MALIFREAHAAPDKKRLNEEYFVLENTGGTAVSTGGLQVVSARKGKRGSVLGVIDPGEKIIVVSGFPGKKSHGEPPTRDGMRVYHLLQREGLLQVSGTTIRLTLNQAEIARLEYDAAAPQGVAVPPAPAAAAPAASPAPAKPPA
jgi:hypothetical protein